MTEGNEPPTLESIVDVLVKNPIRRTIEDLDVLSSVTGRIHFFGSELPEIHKDINRQFFYEFQRRTTDVFTAGGFGDKCYILLKGEVLLVSGALRRRVKPGEMFGELVLLREEPRHFRAICTKDCHFMVINRINYCNVMRHWPETDDIIDFLGKTKLFGPLTKRVMIRKVYLDSQLHTTPIHKVIYHEGSAPDSVFVILDGQFEKYHEVNGKSKVYSVVVPGHTLGEEEMLLCKPRTYSVRCITAEGVVLEIKRRVFERFVMYEEATIALMERLWHEVEKPVFKPAPSPLPDLHPPKQKPQMKLFLENNYPIRASLDRGQKKKRRREPIHLDRDQLEKKWDCDLKDNFFSTLYTKQATSQGSKRGETPTSRMFQWLPRSIPTPSPLPQTQQSVYVTSVLQPLNEKPVERSFDSRIKTPRKALNSKGEILPMLSTSYKQANKKGRTQVHDNEMTVPIYIWRRLKFFPLLRFSSDDIFFPYC